ncbi:hypothetical protein FGO68_gene4911 [Halteria grandinella]|uniref:Uncharacterized protein n=1 Tax=Halteria grandinella TaxID=5974 RepID=A0A8J8NX97_HALGN|nr:hypothetical protein FGO68_gene4911 [Halteria grandinella]
MSIKLDNKMDAKLAYLQKLRNKYILFDIFSYIGTYDQARDYLTLSSHLLRQSLIRNYQLVRGMYTIKEIILYSPSDTLQYSKSELAQSNLVLDFNLSAKDLEQLQDLKQLLKLQFQVQSCKTEIVSKESEDKIQLNWKKLEEFRPNSLQLTINDEIILDISSLPSSIKHLHLIIPHKLTTFNRTAKSSLQLETLKICFGEMYENLQQVIKLFGLPTKQLALIFSEVSFPYLLTVLQPLCSHVRILVSVKRLTPEDFASVQELISLGINLKAEEVDEAVLKDKELFNQYCQFPIKTRHYKEKPQESSNHQDKVLELLASKSKYLESFSHFDTALHPSTESLAIWYSDSLNLPIFIQYCNRQPHLKEIIFHSSTYSFGSRQPWDQYAIKIPNVAFLGENLKQQQDMLLVFAKDQIMELQTDQYNYDHCLFRIGGSKSLESIVYKRNDFDSFQWHIELGQLCCFKNLKKLHYSGTLEFIIQKDQVLESVQEIEILKNEREAEQFFDRIVELIKTCPNLKSMSLDLTQFEHHLTLMLTFPHIRFHFCGISNQSKIDLKLAYLAMNLDQLKIIPVSFDNDLVNAQALVYNIIGATIDTHNVKEFLAPYITVFQKESDCPRWHQSRPQDLNQIYGLHSNILKVILSDINNLLRVFENMHYGPKYTMEAAERIFELQMKSGIKEMLVDAYERQIKYENGVDVNPIQMKMSYQEYYQQLQSGQ